MTNTETHMVEITHPNGTSLVGPYTERGAQTVAAKRTKADTREGWSYKVVAV